MKTLLASLLALVVLGAPLPALAWEPGDELATMLVCSTSAAATTVVTAAEKSGDEATAEMQNFLAAGICWLTNGWPVILVEELHETVDYDGDMVAVWSVKFVEGDGSLFYLWLISLQA